MRVDIDRAGIRLLDSREILGPQMMEQAERAKREAARIAPKDTGTYAATLWVRKSRGKFSTATYGSDLHYARFIEYGSHPPQNKRKRDQGKARATWRIKPHHTLYTAAITVGMRVRGARL